MITHTEAVIFRSVDYQETSKIVTVLTREHGKIALIAKGAKKPKNKLSGLIEVGNWLDMVYYYKESRSVQILTEASYVKKLMNLRVDFEKMATMTSALELISQLLHDNEVNKPLFDFTVKILQWLSETDIHPPLLFPYLQIRLASLTGIGLRLGENIANNKANFLNIETGLISNKQVTAHTIKLSYRQAQFLVTALKSRSSKLFDISFKGSELKSLVECLDRYFKYHVEGIRERKSDAIFEQILQEAT